MKFQSKKYSVRTSTTGWLIIRDNDTGHEVDARRSIFPSIEEMGIISEKKFNDICQKMF